MRTLLDLQKQLVPELMDTMAKRYRLLQYIRLMQPIGRRTLATNLQTSERIVRGEVTLLKEQGLIDLTTAGMTMTAVGETVFLELEGMMSELLGLHSLEERLKQKLGVSQAIVVAGDSDKEEWVKQDLGRACVNELKRVVQANDVLAVMGGTTLAAVAGMATLMKRLLAQYLSQPEADWEKKWKYKRIPLALNLRGALELRTACFMCQTN